METVTATHDADAPVKKQDRPHRRFILHRYRDKSGVSGTGDVAEGVEWSNGRVTICWTGQPVATAVWDSIEDVIQIHGHDGDTVVRWLDEAA